MWAGFWKGGKDEGGRDEKALDSQWSVVSRRDVCGAR